MNTQRWHKLLLVLVVHATGLSSVNAQHEPFADFVKEDRRQFAEWRAGQTSETHHAQPPAKAIPEQALQTTPPMRSAILPGPLLRSAAKDVGAASRQDTKLIRYSGGRAEADGRTAELALTFGPGTVSGRLLAEGIKTTSVHLPSTDISFQRTPFAGKWESPDALIVADWTGGDYADGKPVPGYPVEGRLSIQLAQRDGRTVVYLHRIASSQYGYVFTPQGEAWSPASSTQTNTPIPGNGDGNPVGAWNGRVETANIISNTGALAFLMTFESSGRVTCMVTAAGLDKATTVEGRWIHVASAVQIKWTNDNEKARARFDGPNRLIFDTGIGPIVFTRKGGTINDKPKPPRPPPNKDEILAIELEPDTFKMTPDSSRELPGIIAILKSSLERVPLATDDVEWKIDKGGSIESGQVKLGKTATPGDALTLSATLRDAPSPMRGQACIRVVSELKVGSVSVSVVIDYNPGQPGDSVPRRPNHATVELRPKFGPNKAVMSGSCRGGECITFRNVEPGQYDLWITAIDLPPLPGGYAPIAQPPVHCLGWIEMPKKRWTPDGTVLEYDQEDAARFQVRVPKNDPTQSTSGFVHGRILYKGTPVPKATINVILPPYEKTLYYSNEKGEFAIDTSGMVPGEYRITVEKYIHPRVASDGDYLDVDNAKNNKPILFTVPLTEFNGLNRNIDTLTRAEIFGDTPGDDALPELP